MMHWAAMPHRFSIIAARERLKQGPVYEAALAGGDPPCSALEKMTQ